MPNDQTALAERAESRAINPIVEFKADLARLKESGELDMLPSNVKFDAFRNAAVVAVTDNPNILRCEKASLFRSLRRLAAQGLVPDGREAALVEFAGKAQAMPMVFGLIKTARNSGQVTSIWAEVVYENEKLKLWIEEGERRFSHDYDPLTRDGEIVGAYAVAKLSDGTIEFEPMSRAEIEKRRKVSKTQKGDKPSGIWQQWYAEMAKKTVIRALCKRLPVSAEDMRRIAMMDEASEDAEPPLVEARPSRRGGITVGAPPLDPEPVSENTPADDAEVDVSDAEILPDPTNGAPMDPEWDEGAAAFKAGTPYEQNPHPIPSQAADSWAGGWVGAQKASEGGEA